MPFRALSMAITTSSNSKAIAATALLVMAFVVPPAASSQVQPPKPKKPAKPSTFFQSEKPLDITFTTNIRRLRMDKGATAPWRAATFSYAGPDQKPVVVPLRVRTRGIWRLKSCAFPPVRLNFAGASTTGTVFEGLDKPKLVNHCQDHENYEQYLLQELQLYRVYKLLTPVSHAARLIRMTYADSATGRKNATRFAFMMEDLAVVAARAGGKSIEHKGAGPGDLDPHHDALAGVFQYMIGNTDYSVPGLHNVELVQLHDGNTLQVAYDFDFSGAINARYATTDPSLSIKRVRDRLFRGFCVEKEVFTKVFTLFNAKRDEIYALYRDDIGRLLAPQTVNETLKYFDEFYRTINDPRASKREIFDACRGRGD